MEETQPLKVCLWPEDNLHIHTKKYPLSSLQCFLMWDLFHGIIWRNLSVALQLVKWPINLIILQPLDLLNLTLNSYTLEEMLALERQVLRVLEFDLTYADPTIFLNYFLHLTCSEDDTLVGQEWAPLHNIFIVSTITEFLASLNQNSDEGGFLVLYESFFFVYLHVLSTKVVECAGFSLEVVMVERWPLLTRPSLLAAAAVHSATCAIHPVSSSMRDPVYCTSLSPIILLMPKYFR